MPRRTIATLGLAAVIGLLAVPARSAETVGYAGTIRDLDLETGAFVVNDVGPSRTGAPAPVTARAIALTPATVIAEVTRAQDSDSGFRGDYATRLTTRAELANGEFVAVECTPVGRLCEAVDVTLVRTDSAW